MSIIGIPIGFYGYLFPGNINLMVLHLYSEKRYRFLLFIFVLAVFFESTYCFFSLYFFSRFNANLQWLSYLKHCGYALTLLMGIWMLLDKKTKRENQNTSTVYRGFISIIIHPQQIPFWLLVGVLFQDIIFKPLSFWSLLQFVVFNAIGTFLILLCYALLGKKLLDFIKLNITQITKIIGLSYILISLSYLLKIL